MVSGTASSARSISTRARSTWPWSYSYCTWRSGLGLWLQAHSSASAHRLAVKRPVRMPEPLAPPKAHAGALDDPGRLPLSANSRPSEARRRVASAVPPRASGTSANDCGSGTGLALALVLFTSTTSSK